MGYFFKGELETLDRFKIFKSIVENEMNTMIKFLRSNRGGEFTSNEFERSFEEHASRRHMSTCKAP